MENIGANKETGNLIKQAAAGVGNFVSDTTSVIKEQGEILHDNTVGKNGLDLVKEKPSKEAEKFIFPNDLAGFGIPVVAFNCLEEDNKTTLYFPCPSNQTFAATGAYNQTDMSLTADMANEAAGLIEKGVKAIKTVAGGEVNTTDANKLSGVANNKTESKFTGNAIRNFSFSFSLIPKTPSESNQIKKVVHYVNQMVYAPKIVAGQALGIPPVWKIKFLIATGAGGSFKENRFMSRIAESYLTNFQAIYNASNSSFYEDGSPQAIDLQFTFQEVKMLTRDELVTLESAENKIGFEIAQDILKQKPQKLSSSGTSSTANLNLNSILNSAVGKVTSKFKF